MLSNKALLDQLLGEDRNGVVKADVHFTDQTVCKYNLVWGHCPTQVVLGRECPYRHDGVLRTEFNRQWAKYKELVCRSRDPRFDPNTSGDPWGYSYDTIRFLDREAHRIDETVKESHIRVDVTKEMHIDHELFAKVCDKINVLVDEANSLVDEGKVDEGTDCLELVQSLEMKKTELITRFVEEYFHFKNGGTFSQNPLVLNPPTDKLQPSPAAAALIAEQEQKMMQQQQQSGNFLQMMNPMNMNMNPMNMNPMNMNPMGHPQFQQMHPADSFSSGVNTFLPPPPASSTENASETQPDLDSLSPEEREKKIIEDEIEKENTKSHKTVLSKSQIDALGLSTAENFREAESLLQRQKLRACLVCGLMLSVSDPAQRVTEHFLGKTHKGFKALRRFVSQITAQGTPRSISFFAEARSLPEDVLGRRYKTVDPAFFTLTQDKSDKSDKHENRSSNDKINQNDPDKNAQLHDDHDGASTQNLPDAPAPEPLTEEQLAQRRLEEIREKQFARYESMRLKLIASSNEYDMYLTSSTASNHSHHRDRGQRSKYRSSSRSPSPWDREKHNDRRRDHRDRDRDRDRYKKNNPTRRY